MRRVKSAITFNQILYCDNCCSGFNVHDYLVLDGKNYRFRSSLLCDFCIEKCFAFLKIDTGLKHNPSPDEKLYMTDYS